MRKIVIKETPLYHNYLSELSSQHTENAFLLKTNNPDKLRYSTNREEIPWIMPLGGPLIQQGRKIGKTNIVVESVFIVKKNSTIYPIVCIRDDN